MCDGVSCDRWIMSEHGIARRTIMTSFVSRRTVLSSDSARPPDKRKRRNDEDGRNHQDEAWQTGTIKVSLSFNKTSLYSHLTATVHHPFRHRLVCNAMSSHY
jgi:hypothetical protein